MVMNVTFNFSHRIWSFSTVDFIRKDPSCPLRVGGLLCNHALLQSLSGESQSVAHPADLLVPLEESQEEWTGCVNWQRETIPLSCGSHPLCCCPAGCVRGCVPLFSHGGLDFHRVSLLLLCGIQYSRIWGFCQRPESSAPGPPSVQGCKLSGNAARGLLHPLALQCPLLDHQAGTELDAERTGADAGEWLLLQVTGLNTLQVLYSRSAAHSPVLLGRQHSAGPAGAKGHVLRPHYGVNTSASEFCDDESNAKNVQLSHKVFQDCETSRRLLIKMHFEDQTFSFVCLPAATRCSSWLDFSIQWDIPFYGFCFITVRIISRKLMLFIPVKTHRREHTHTKITLSLSDRMPFLFVWAHILHGLLSFSLCQN